MTNSAPKHAFITGAAIRVGRAVALHLAEAGWDITIHCHRSVKEAESLAAEIRTRGLSVQIIQGDLSNPEDVGTLFTKASAPVNLLIHNASVFEKDGLGTLSPERFLKHMQVNLLAPLLLTQQFQRQLPKGVRGDVICLLDGMQGWSVSAHYLSYSLSKLALKDSVQLLASTLSPHIRINGIALGATLPGAQDHPSTFEKIRALTPLKQTSSPKEVCAAIDFLLRSNTTTGQIIDLSGGMSLPALHATE